MTTSSPSDSKNGTQNRGASVRHGVYSHVLDHRGVARTGWKLGVGSWRLRRRRVGSWRRSSVHAAEVERQRIQVVAIRRVADEDQSRAVGREQPATARRHRRRRSGDGAGLRRRRDRARTGRRRGPRRTGSSAPSGIHIGVTFRPSRAGGRACGRRRVATSTRTISDGPPRRRRSAAIERPSGDQRGDENSVASSATSVRGCASSPAGGSTSVASTRRPRCCTVQTTRPAVGRHIRIGGARAARQAPGVATVRRTCIEIRDAGRRARRTRADRTPAVRCRQRQPVAEIRDRDPLATCHPASSSISAGSRAGSRRE